MAAGYTPPTISVSFDADTETYELMATNHNRTAPVGERIFRAEPWPDIKFRHTDKAAATHDAQVLREYLEECASGKRKGGAPVGRGWWQ